MKKSIKIFVVFCFLVLQVTHTKAQQQIFDHQQPITDGRVWDVAFEDFNKDNVPDVLYVRNGRNNLVYLSDEDGSMQSNTINTNHSDGLYISLGDVDSDDDIDAIITNFKQPNVLWINNGYGAFTKADSGFGSNGYNADLCDINNDGTLDVICSINGKVIVWFNKGNNSYERSAQSVGYSKSFGRVKLADTDNDNDLDIVLANRSAGGSIWLNDGSGVFSETINNLTKSSTETELKRADLSLHHSNEERNHDGLGGFTPAEALEKAKVSTLELPVDTSPLFETVSKSIHLSTP